MSRRRLTDRRQAAIRPHLSEEELGQRFEALRRGALPDEDIYSTVHQFGRQNYLRARPDVERLLSSENPHWRYIALEVLLNHWRLDEHWQTACDMLNCDDYAFNRGSAASRLGFLMRNTSDRATLTVLAFMVRHEQEEESVRLDAYMAMKQVLHDDRAEQWWMLQHRARTWREVDWSLVDSYLRPPARVL